MCARTSAAAMLLTPVIPLVLGGCATPASSPASQPELPRGPEAEWNLVVIGDSSLWGLGEALASQIEDDVGVKVVLYDAAVGGLSAGEVLKALHAGNVGSLKLRQLPEALKQAEMVVLWANPEDSLMPERPNDIRACLGSRTPKGCPPESFEKFTADLEAIWAEILELRAGQPTILRATDLYNPLVVPWQENGVFEACTLCWENMSDAARLAAEAYDIPFLSRYDAFNGANHDEDPRQKGYIRGDGEHPSDLANRYAAELLSEMGYEPVTPP